MPREIKGNTVTGNFPPLVGIRKKGNFVKGKVVEKGNTRSQNPTVTLALIDLDGSTSISPSKGVYQEVDVNVGDAVQVIGSIKDLREKLPQLEIGDIVTITNVSGRVAIGGGKTAYTFKVEVE